MVTDPIADYLTRMRNAIAAKHRVVEIPGSKLKKEITKILFEKGYILNYKFVDDGPQGTIKLALKYDAVNGLGIAIVSTSKGLMTDKEARTLNVGGEVLCYIS